MVNRGDQTSAFAAYSSKSKTDGSRKNTRNNKRKPPLVYNAPTGAVTKSRIKPKELAKKKVPSTNKLKLIKKTVRSARVEKHTVVIKKPNPANTIDKKLLKKKSSNKLKNHAKSKVKGNKVSTKKSTDEDTCPAAQSVKNVASSNYDATAEAKKLFRWLIYPMKINNFFTKNWEQAPLHVKRDNPNYYKLLMSTPMLDTLLREYYILFTKNIDITSYSNGIRETHNPEGRALPSVVWDYYSNGCSVRMLNPQTFISKLHTLNATLQELFGCFVGANSYLTPPNSQGFAPHYDDIEAFILQIEGKKRWRLYKPRNQNEYLPRFSSQNFDQSEIGEPILDTVVSAGDLLYFPRGTIHQGETIDDQHSLHITLSVYQRNSWGDLMENLVPQALQQAIENDSKFREGLPLGYLNYMGFAHSTEERNTDLRQAFVKNVKGLFSRILDHINVDKAADSMGQTHIHAFLPPVLTQEEQKCSVTQDGERMTTEGIVKCHVEIEPDTRIRLLRSHCARLVEDSDTFKIYYSTENSKEYHEYEPQYLEVGIEFVPAVKEIISRYPQFIRVEDLPIDGEDNKIQIVKDLWEKCIVVTDQPLSFNE